MRPSLQCHAVSMNSSDFTTPCITLVLDAPGAMGSLTIYCSSLDKMGIAYPPAESIAAVDPAAVETLRPLERQFTKGEQDWPSFLILKENRETVAGHGCAIKTSLRAYADSSSELTEIDILDNSDGAVRSSRMLSNI